MNLDTDIKLNVDIDMNINMGTDIGQDMDIRIIMGKHVLSPSYRYLENVTMSF
jgi:hypothetical protein